MAARVESTIRMVGEQVEVTACVVDDATSEPLDDVNGCLGWDTDPKPVDALEAEVDTRLGALADRMRKAPALAPLADDLPTLPRTTLVNAKTRAALEP